MKQDELSFIIFVGMNNKPGIPPLDSSTKSGKLIDRLISELKDKFRFKKTNLFDLDHFPKGVPQDKALVEWMIRVGYNPGDIIVPLGAWVHPYFRNSKLKPIVYLGHPSAVWSNENKEKYLTRAVVQIMQNKS
jgi:hypothetical protein